MREISHGRRIAVAIAILVVADVALLWSPLRVLDDTLAYLQDSVDLVDGKGFHDDHLPPGYPYVLAAWNLVGLGTPAGIVALNLITMAAGLAAIAPVLRRDLELSPQTTTTICVLCCYSWLWIRQIIVPMPEMVYFCLSSLASAALSNGGGRVIPVILAAAMSWAAFETRTIGAALFPAVALAAIETRPVRNLVTRRTAIVLLAVGLCIAGPLAYCYRTLIVSKWYAGPLGYLMRGRADDVVSQIAWCRFGELGEAMANVSASALSPQAATLPIDSESLAVLATQMLHSVRMIVGFLAAIVIFAGLWSRRAKLSYLETYLGGYCGILLIWPFESTRFLAPIVPFLLSYGRIGLRTLESRFQVRRIAGLYCVLFTLFGASALGDALRVTFIDRASIRNELPTPDLGISYATWRRYGGLSVDEIDNPETRGGADPTHRLNLRRTN